MKEQINAPIGEGSSEDQNKEEAPKKLERPGLPQSLPQVPVTVHKNIIVGWRCSCGLAGTKKLEKCGAQNIPIYAHEGWDGSHKFKGDDE